MCFVVDADLNPLDHLLAQQVIEVVRYADDFVILCRTPEAAELNRSFLPLFR